MPDVTRLEPVALAEELSRCRSVAARHAHNAETDAPHAQLWRDSAERHAQGRDRLAAEARRRLALPGPEAAEVARALTLFRLDPFTV